MTVQIDLDRVEKRVLLDIIDTHGNVARNKRNKLGFFSFSEKHEVDEFLDLIKEVYMTVRITIDDDGEMYFPDAIAYALQSIITAEMQYVKFGQGTINNVNPDIFTKIIDQVMLNPRFA